MASGSMVLPPTSGLNPPLEVSNGHLSPSIDETVSRNGISNDSGSDLSDLRDPAKVKSSSSPAGSAQHTPTSEEDEQMNDVESSAHDENASEDADFDIETPLAGNSPEARRRRSSSHESRRPSKRKLGVEDDEFIMSNPELYGLRRSGRARPTRRVIESSTEDNDSGSDALATSSRKKRKVGPSQKSSKRATPAIQTPTESDSDSDAYGGRRRGVSKKDRRRQLQFAAGLAPPPHGEVRFSTRRAAKVTSYNEEDDDDIFSEEESEMTPNYWATGTDDNTPAIDIVLNHRLKEDVDPEKSRPGREDFEYYIKWQNQAHYHSTWETSTSLASCRGIRRLDNYIRKIISEEVRMTHDPDVSPEDKEKYSLDREQVLAAVDEHMKVERIIGSQTGDETEYLVKWKGLAYEACTWETASLVSEIAQSEIDRFLDRTSHLPVSDKTQSRPETRVAFKPFREQPSYIKYGQLREFQIHGVNFLAYNWSRSQNVILADEMGLGKTVQTVSFMNWLRHERGQQGPFLVVVPLSTMPAWAETFDNWTPDVNYVVYNGNEASRTMIRDYELLVNGNPRQVKFHVLLTTYEFILQDAAFLSQIRWQFLAVDEAHRLKNRQSQLYTKLHDFKTPNRLLITGTPIQNNLEELSALMDFLMPGEVVIDHDMDLTSEAAAHKIEELNNTIKPFMLRRTKQRVENDLPPKTEKIIRVELSDVQLEYYKNILTKNYAALNQGAKGPKQSLLNIMMELKKASNHPFMFPTAEERILGGRTSREDVLKSLITSSGKMMLLDQLLTKFKRDDHRVLIFSQMVKMLDILGDYLQLRGHQFQRLDGTMPAGQRRLAIDHFNAPDSNDFCFLLSTRAGGLGINLMTADTVILFDSDWNPQADLQAMARAHRIGQKKPVSVYRLVSKETVEEEILERARNKLMLEFITIQRGVTDNVAKEITNKMVKAGRVHEPTSSDDISRILKKRGQKMFEQSGNQKKLEELDIDAVLANAEEHKTETASANIEADGGEEFLKSFEYMDVKVDLEWDQIIPREQLDEIKAEEKRKADEQYLAEVIEQNAPRKRKQPGDDREQRAAKKRARDLAAEAAEAEESDEDNLDPMRPLNEKEYRNLYRAFVRYGSIDDRGDELIQDAGLTNRDRSLLKSILDEFTDISEGLLQDEQTRFETLERESSKPLTKKDKKAVLFDYKGVKRLNAETIIERPAEMRMLRDVIESLPDYKAFRIPEASKAAHYTCDWGAREDGMLCVGIHKYGYGAWVQIRDDPDLGMGDKFYLEEHRVDKKAERSNADDKQIKSPGAVHLVRRADYLLSVLKEKMSNGTNIAARRAVENHHRNNKKAQSIRRAEKSSASPAPYHSSKVSRESDKHRHRLSHTDHRASTERHGHKGDIKRKHHGEDDDERRKRKRSEDSPHLHHKRSSSNVVNGVAHHSDVDPVLKELFKPVRDSLEHVQSATKEKVSDKVIRAKILREELPRIGNFIKSILSGKSAKEADGLEQRLWKYVGLFWPNPGTAWEKLKLMHEKIVESDAANAAKKEDTKDGVKPNGLAVGSK